MADSLLNINKGQKINLLYSPINTYGVFPDTYWNATDAQDGGKYYYTIVPNNFIALWGIPIEWLMFTLFIVLVSFTLNIVTSPSSISETTKPKST